MSDTQHTCEHYQHGIGTAILIKYRRKSKDDLFMCSFGKVRRFYCRKHLLEGEEIWFSDGKPRKVIKKSNPQKELEEQLRGFFFGGVPENT